MTSTLSTIAISSLFLGITFELANAFKNIHEDLSAYSHPSYRIPLQSTGLTTRQHQGRFGGRGGGFNQPYFPNFGCQPYGYPFCYYPPCLMSFYPFYPFFPICQPYPPPLCNFPPPRLPMPYYPPYPMPPNQPMPCYPPYPMPPGPLRPMPPGPPRPMPPGPPRPMPLGPNPLFRKGPSPPPADRDLPPNEQPPDSPEKSDE